MHQLYLFLSIKTIFMVNEEKHLVTNSEATTTVFLLLPHMLSRLKYLNTNFIYLMIANIGFFIPHTTVFSCFSLEELLPHIIIFLKLSAQDGNKVTPWIC